MIHMNHHVSMGIKYLTTHFLAMSHCVKFRVLVNEPKRIHWRRQPILAWLPNPACSPKSSGGSGRDRIKVTLAQCNGYSASHLPIVTLKSSSRNINKAVLAPQ